MHIIESIKSPKLVELLKDGSVGVIPTDTVYGIVCSASQMVACQRLYKIKQKNQSPGTIIAANIEQLVSLGLKYRYLKAVEQFWPGPVSVIIPTSNKNLSYLHLGKDSLAVRLPKDKDIVGLLSRTGPLLTSSANPHNKPPATNIIEVKNYFKNQLDFIVNGGTLDGKPSSIIRVIDDEIVVLRK